MSTLFGVYIKKHVNKNARCSVEQRALFVKENHAIVAWLDRALAVRKPSDCVKIKVTCQSQRKNTIGGKDNGKRNHRHE